MIASSKFLVRCGDFISYPKCHLLTLIYELLCGTDHLNVVELAGHLMQKDVIPYQTEDITDQQTEVIDKVLELMLCILDGLSNSSNRPSLIDVRSQWRPIFDLRSKRYDFNFNSLTDTSTTIKPSI